MSAQESEQILVQFRDTINNIVQLKYSSLENMRTADFGSYRKNLQLALGLLSKITRGSVLETTLIKTTNDYCEKVFLFIETKIKGQPVEKNEAEVIKASTIFKECFKNYVDSIREQTRANSISASQSPSSRVRSHPINSSPTQSKAIAKSDNPEKRTLAPNPSRNKTQFDSQSPQQTTASQKPQQTTASQSSIQTKASQSPSQTTVPPSQTKASQSLSQTTASQSPSQTTTSQSPSQTTASQSPQQTTASQSSSQSHQNTWPPTPSPIGNRNRLDSKNSQQSQTPPQNHQNNSPSLAASTPQYPIRSNTENSEGPMLQKSPSAPESEAEKRRKLIEEKKRQILQKKAEEQKKVDEEKQKLDQWEKTMQDAVRSRVRNPIDQNQRKEMMLNYLKEWEIKPQDIRYNSKLVQIEAKRRGILNLTAPKQVLAKGGFGVIYLVEINYTLAAMKVLDAVSATEKEAQSEFEQELELLTRLRHPNILLYLGGSTSNPTDFFFLTELMETDLSVLIKNKDPRAEWKNQGKYFSRDIASALSYLHSKQLVHKDMKSANILINRSVAKLADFGLTKTVEEKNNRLTIDRAFSASWASPEQINPNAIVSYPTDIYSFAITIWEILTGKVPWDGVGTFQLITATAAGEFKKWHPVPKDSPPELDLLLTKCWNAEPEKRPNAEMCLIIIEGMI